MDDMISRQAAIDALDEQIRQCDKALSAFDISMKDEYAVKVERASLVAFRETLEYMSSAQPGWIPCSKKLPELNRSVLVQLSDDFVDPIQIMTLNISKCEGDFFYFWETQEMGINFEMGDVVAWMPLPTQWEGGQEQNHESTI